jgi:hypothetical protein
MATRQSLFLKLRRNMWSGLPPSLHFQSCSKCQVPLDQRGCSILRALYGPAFPPLDIRTCPLSIYSSSGHTSLIPPPPPPIRMILSSKCLLLSLSHCCNRVERHRYGRVVMLEVLLCYGSFKSDYS